MIFSSAPGLIMTCSTIGKFVEFFLVIPRPGFMTVQAPTHIQYLRVLSNFNLRHIPMTVLAVQPGCYVRPMREMDKIRHLRYRHPWNGLVSFDIAHQLN